MIKKLFIISSALLIITLVFGGIYYFVFKKNADIASLKEDKVAAPAADTAAPEKKAAEGKFAALTDGAILAPTVSKDGAHIRYYTVYNGNVYDMTLDGEDKRMISSNVLFGLKNVVWSPDKSKVISTYDKEGANSFSIYDYDARSGNNLADGTTNVVWSNLGDKIIYSYFDAGKNKGNVSMADPDGKNWQKLADISWRSAYLAPVPQTSLISFWNTPDAYTETSLETAGLVGEAAKKIFSGKFGADYLWSPDGNKILISSSDAKGSSKITLGVANSNGEGYQNLNIPTMISKCVWSNNGRVVYYALPGSIPDGTVMPNDYQAKKITTQDTFWKVDVTNGKQERVVELKEMGGSSKTFDASNLFLSTEEDALFFVNRVDGKLYKIDL